MTNQPPSPRLKIERAKEHAAYLKTRIGEFRERNPYRAVFNGDAQGGWATFAVRVDEDIPPMWGVVVGEVLHLCRTSLDNAWFIIGGRTRRDEFPFAQDLDAFKTRFKGKAKGAIKTAVEVLASIESYRTGNPLWILSNLDNLNKHESPLLCSSRLRDFVITSGGAAHPVAFLEPLEEGSILLLPVASEVELNVEHRIPFEVTFEDVEFANGGAVVPILESFVSEADKILSAFAASGLIL